MNKIMYTIAETQAMIKEGRKLVLAADSKALSRLPKGNWIAGSMPYFMPAEGGLESDELVQVTELPSFATQSKIQLYTQDNLRNIYLDGYKNGFTILIIPCFSSILSYFALESTNFPGFASCPLMGWVSGTHLGVFGEESPLVFAESGEASYRDLAVAMHVELPETHFAEVGILNIFAQGEGDLIDFPQSGFSVDKAIVNGHEINFYDYIQAKHIDIRFPLVADYNGTLINVSFQNLLHDQKRVELYAPVFEGVTYKLAHVISDYRAAFHQSMPKLSGDQLLVSYNCILNYVYCELKGKKTVPFVGPVTFGEVAYQLLNQTLVYLEIGTFK